MNTIICLIAALIALSTPATGIKGSAFKGLETAWSISYKAAQIVLAEKVANQSDEEKDEDATEESKVAENASGYTDADIAYWNGLARQYGFQAYNGFGDFNQFVESAQQLVQNAQTYGDPYYVDEGLQSYYEDEDGVLWENPVYEDRWGPEDDPTNQVQPVEPEQPVEPPAPPVAPPAE